MKVSIFIAASGRPKMLSDMLESLERNNLSIVETVFVVDEDFASYKVATDFPACQGKVIDYRDYRRGALNAWNRSFQLCTGDIFVPAGDDQLFPLFDE